MKEMTIEQKVQRYDEALKRAKKLYEQGTITESLNYVFPELKESEDEKIRKSIIKYLEQSQFGEEHYCVDDDVVRDYIAWLEKQGEPVEINPTEFDTRLQSLIGKFGNLPKEELIGSLSFWLNVVQNDKTYKDEEKQGKQKSTDNDRKYISCPIRKKTIKIYTSIENSK